jgi:hypothetical protein
MTVLGQFADGTRPTSWSAILFMYYQKDSQVMWMARSLGRLGASPRAPSVPLESRGLGRRSHGAKQRVPVTGIRFAVTRFRFPDSQQIFPALATREFCC